jgi:hypothetical protein
MQALTSSATRSLALTRLRRFAERYMLVKRL